MELREGSAFDRGRALGRFEKEVAWQLHEVGVFDDELELPAPITKKNRN